MNMLLSSVLHSLWAAALIFAIQAPSFAQSASPATSLLGTAPGQTTPTRETPAQPAERDLKDIAAFQSILGRCVRRDNRQHARTEFAKSVRANRPPSAGPSPTQRKRKPQKVFDQWNLQGIALLTSLILVDQDCFEIGDSWVIQRKVISCKN
jgi:hypothetical protein